MRGMIGGDYEPTLVTLFSAPAFFILFLLIIWLVYRRDHREKYEAYAKLPITNDSKNQEGEHE